MGRTKPRLDNNRTYKRARRKPYGRLFSAIALVTLLIILFFVAGGSLLNGLTQKLFYGNTTQNVSQELTSLFDFPQTETYYNDGGDLEIHFIDVGQGDATLIGCDGEWMMIDAGGYGNGTMLQKYLMDCGVKELKYMIGTHPDADHIDSMDVIMTKFPCTNVFMPDVEKDTWTYERVINTARYMNYNISCPEPGTQFALGGATFTVLAPLNEYEDANNSSICIRLLNGKFAYLFTGDAEYEAIADILNSKQEIRADVYKMGHHGAKNANTPEFINAIKPTYAVISCGKDNDYGHPHQSVLNTLQKNGVSVFRTDEQGTIVCTSDGNTINWSTEPSETWQAGTFNMEGAA